MNNRKLTYYQICKLVAQNRFDEIPSGYNIIFLSCEPGVCFETDLGGDCITFSNDRFIKPDSIHIKGEYAVLMPTLPGEKIEYGDVVITTYFDLTELKFFYKDESAITPFDYFKDDCRKPLLKKDCVFDAEINLSYCKINVFNILMTSYTLNDIIEVELIHDYTTCTFI